MPKIKQSIFPRAKTMKGKNPLFANNDLKSNKPIVSNDNLIFASGNRTLSYIDHSEKNVQINISNSYLFKNHTEPHKMPIKHIPNSTIIQRDDGGNIVSIRYYDENGNAYKDIDYTDHGAPNTHRVPHTHDIIIIDNKIIRKKGTLQNEY